MLSEQAAVQIGHVAKRGFDIGAVGSSALLGKAAKEQGGEKAFIETDIQLGFKMPRQTRLQIVFFAVQKTFFLQKPQKHQPINEDGGVPALVFADVFTG